MNNDLLPCPFCGSNYQRKIEEYDKTRKEIFYFIKCGFCGSQSSEADTKDQAIEDWNTRDSEWVSIKNGLFPSPENLYLLYDGKRITVGNIDIYGKFICYLTDEEFFPTHYLIPTTPKGTK